MNNTHDLMRKYSEIVAGRQINESIEDGILDVVDRRLEKTISMIDDLISNIRDDAPETVCALEELSGKLQSARESISPIQTKISDVEIVSTDETGDLADDWGI